MQLTRTERIVSTVAALLLVAGGLWLMAGGQTPTATRLLAAEGDSNFTNVVASGYIMAGDDLTVSDDITSGDDLTVTDNLFVGEDANLTKQTRIVVTDGSTIAPLGSYQPISSTANTGTSSITAGTAGDLLVLVNVGSSTITLTDTGTLKLSGNAALGNSDAVILLADGTNWLQIAPEGDN